MEDILLHPFVIGLIVGLIITCIVWAKSLMRLREAQREVRKLKEHLQTQMELDAESKGNRKKRIEDLEKKNENLRITIQNLNQKPGKIEIRQYYVYQKAVEMMFERAPGFAPAWQSTVREAEQQIADAEQGIVPLIKRVIGSPFTAKALPENASHSHLESEEGAGVGSEDK